MSFLCRMDTLRALMELEVLRRIRFGQLTISQHCSGEYAEVATSD